MRKAKTEKSGLRFLNLEKFGLATVIVGGLTLLSRLVGLFRTRLMTGKFGAGQTLDVYYTAFRLPDLLMGIFIVGTLALSVLPVVSEYMVKKPGEASLFISRMLNFVILGMGILITLCFIFAPTFVHWIAPGFDGKIFDETVTLTRMVLLAQMFLAPANMLTGVLNATKRFFWSYLAPLFYNLGLIVGVIWLYDIYGILGLGYGVILGAVANFLCLLTALLFTGFRWEFSLKVDPGIKKAFRLYVPRLLMLDLTQVALLLATFFGSWLVAGSISFFNLGFDLQAVPVGVLGVASAIAVFPLLAEQYNLGDDEKYLRYLSQAAAKIIFYMAPVSVLMLLLRAHLVRLIYGVGNFSWNDTYGTFTVLGILSFSMICQALVPLMSRAILARQLSWVPVIANLVGILTMIIVSAFTGRLLGINGVALAYVSGITLNAICLYVYLRQLISVQLNKRDLMLRVENWVSGQVWRMLVSTVLLSICTYFLLYAFAPFFNVHTWLGLALQAGIAGGIGLLVYFYSSLLLKVEEAVALKDWVVRFRK